jgi:ParB-like chromosome segregation protein Spo0J
LAEEINDSREINPLIVVIEGKDLEEDMYILEGGHRFDALRLLGIKEFPAVVVLEK